MGIFNKLFNKDEFKKNNPDNAKLLELLEAYRKNEKDGYKNVLNELLNGNSLLIIRSSTANSYGWNNSDKEKGSRLTPLRADGLKVMAAFTDESLLGKSEKPIEYVTIRSKDFLKQCQESNIDSIVINIGHPNEYVIERNREEIKEHQILDNSVLQIAKPDNPLSEFFLKKVIDNIKTNDTVIEMYQYSLVNQGELSIVLAFRLTVYNHNSRIAVMNAVQNAQIGEKVYQPLDIFFLNSDEWYDKVKRVKESLIYKK